MQIKNSPNNRLCLHQQSGFSLVEVLIAFSILLILLVGVFKIRLDSIRRIEHSGDLNQMQNSIRKDLANVRKQALKWNCQQGACSGLIDDRNIASRYSDSHCSETNPLEKFPVQTKALSSDNPKIKISRTVIINGKQLDVTYIAETDEKQIETRATITPQAMNWCGEL